MSQPGNHVSDRDETTVQADFLHSCYSLAFQVPMTNTRWADCC